MKLEVFKQISYISPSALAKWRNCQYSVYLQRLAGLPFIPEPQGMAAAIGSAFDAFVKDVIVKRKGWKVPFTLNTLLNRNVTVKGDERKEALERGKFVAGQYIQSKLFQRVMDTVTEVEREYYTNIGGVPILGQVDAIVDDVIFDWKLRGFKSNKIPSPTKGYNLKFNLKTLIEEPMHTDRFPLIEKNIDWAKQLAIYDMCTHKYSNKYIIHEITPDCMVEHKGSIALNSFRLPTLKIPFYIDLMSELEAMWEAIHGQLLFADIQPPEPHDNVCRKYNVLCSVAQHCGAFTRFMLDPERRKFLCK